MKAESAEKKPKVFARIVKIFCPGCRNPMEVSMNLETCHCRLKSCEYHGVYFETPRVELIPKEGR